MRTIAGEAEGSGNNRSGDILPGAVVIATGLTCKTGAELSGTIGKYDCVIKKHKNKLRYVETKRIQALVAKNKVTNHLTKVRASRNSHREKTVTAEKELKEVKNKNKVLTKMLSAEKTKSTEINHRAWLDKKAKHTLLTEATKSHQAELKN